MATLASHLVMVSEKQNPLAANANIFGMFVSDGCWGPKTGHQRSSTSSTKGATKLQITNTMLNNEKRRTWMNCEKRVNNVKQKWKLTALI